MGDQNRGGLWHCFIKITRFLFGAGKHKTTHGNGKHGIQSTGLRQIQIDPMHAMELLDIMQENTMSDKMSNYMWEYVSIHIIMYYYIILIISDIMSDSMLDRLRIESDFMEITRRK
jgi:hypothetical protein